MQGDAHAEALASARAEAAAAQARAVDAQARAGTAAIEVERLLIECASARREVAELKLQQQQLWASSTAAGQSRGGIPGVSPSGWSAGVPPGGVSPSPQRGGGGGGEGRGLSSATSPLLPSQSATSMRSSLFGGADGLFSPFPTAVAAMGGLAMGGTSAVSPAFSGLMMPTAAASPVFGGMMMPAASPTSFSSGPGRSAVRLSLPPMASPQGGYMHHHQTAALQVGGGGSSTQQAAAEQEVGPGPLPSSASLAGAAGSKWSCPSPAVAPPLSPLHCGPNVLRHPVAIFGYPVLSCRPILPCAGGAGPSGG